MQPQRLDHVSLNVTDRSRSITWYRDVLGLPQLNQPTSDDEPVFLGQPGLQFGLFQAQRQSPAREPESSGLRHVAIVVDDLDAAQERLRSHGVEFRYENHGNALSVYFGDPDGHVLELTTYVRLTEAASTLRHVPAPAALSHREVPASAGARSPGAQ